MAEEVLSYSAALCEGAVMGSSFPNFTPAFLLSHRARARGTANLANFRRVSR
jgi:hypothetical protein